MRLLRLFWTVFLPCLGLAGQAQVADDKWDRADRETVRLQPTHFVGVPKPVKATLSEQGYRIPPNFSWLPRQATRDRSLAALWRGPRCGHQEMRRAV